MTRIAFSVGQYKEPRDRFLALIMQSIGEDREKNNREMLCVRVTLADAVRRDDEGDVALMLSRNLSHSQGR